MQVVRRYKKNDWWDFCTVIEQEIARDHSIEVFINLIDELNWRKIENISEGGVYKIKSKAKEVGEKFYSIHKENLDPRIEEFTSILDEILR